jgi:hypothetical protein
MPLITLPQLQKRTRHELISDEEALCLDPYRGLQTVRRAERAMEARYPIHRYLRRAAVWHFRNTGWDVLPHGVGVRGTGRAMADLAISKGRRIVFVECLTRSWVNYSNAQRKRHLEIFFPLWFVIEDPVGDSDIAYRRRAERLAARSRVLFWSHGRALRVRPHRKSSDGRRRNPV